MLLKPSSESEKALANDVKTVGYCMQKDGLVIFILIIRYINYLTKKERK